MIIVVAMIFFAANSLLARAALRSGSIDANSFTAVRLLSGAVALALLTRARGESVRSTISHASWMSAATLCVYAVTFSYAYISLTASTGALLMFTAVQATMICGGILRNEAPRPAEWIGLAVAFGGFVYLALPGLAAPSRVGTLLMTVSGITWGMYTLQARGVASPVAATAANFIRSAPIICGTFLALCLTTRPHITPTGFALAGTSGAITSGMGYVLWYSAARRLRPSIAAIIQLTVPLLAAGAGVLLLGEPLTWRLALASALIFGGIGLAIAGRTRRG